MGNDIADNTFFEVQAEKFYQKKVEVARGVIELGQILIETKEKLPHGSWIKWLEDIRVNFTPRTAQRYMERTKFYKSECDRLRLDKLETCFHFEDILNEITGREFKTLKSAPEEVKEDVANSTSQEEAKKKIKEYEEQLKQEKQDKEVSSVNHDSDVVIKRERKPIPETVKKSVRVRSGNSCERCGYNFTKFPIEEFHHINENPSDNRLDNILHLCPNCHALEHYILRGGELNE